MSLSKLRDKLSGLAKENGMSFSMDWPDSLNEGDKEYPMLLVMPAKRVSKKSSNDDRWKIYHRYPITMYALLLRHDEKGDLDESDRAKHWDMASAYLDKIIAGIHKSRNESNFIQYIIPESDVVHEPDELSEGNDQLIWQKVEFELEVLREDC